MTNESHDLLATLRGYRRLPEILAVLVRHGLGDLVEATGLDRFLGHGAVEPAPKGGSRRPVRMRHALEELGPTFTKLGQVLGLRPDLIPDEYANEFRRLHDACPPVPFAEVDACLREDFGDQLDALFASVDPEPLAAGSVAQVHRATLADGTAVVIKVLRPGVRRTVDADMELLWTVARFVEGHLANPGFHPTRVVEEFSQELRRELDLTLEGKSTDRLRRYFEDDRDIRFPKVHWGTTTRNVLTLEEIDGTPLSRIDVDALTAADRRRIVETGARAVFRQCLEFGFFHADPHPGNIFVMPDGRVCFIDCGMVGHLDSRTSAQLADLIASIAADRTDLDRIVRVSLALGGGDPIMAEDRGFREDAWEFVSRFDQVTLDSLKMGSVLEDFFTLLRKHDVRCPSDLVFLIKAISTIEGVARDIDPSFDLVGYVRPQIEQLLAERYGFAALRRRFERSVTRYAEVVERLPDDVRMLLDRVRGDTFSVRLEHQRLESMTDTLEHASRNIAYALLIAALLVSSAILILSDRIAEAAGALTTVGMVGLVVSAVLIVVLALGNVRRGR